VSLCEEGDLVKTTSNEAMATGYPLHRGIQVDGLSLELTDLLFSFAAGALLGLHLFMQSAKSSSKCGAKLQSRASDIVLSLLLRALTGRRVSAAPDLSFASSQKSELGIAQVKWRNSQLYNSY
jgi:hypothetical protein